VHEGPLEKGRAELPPVDCKFVRISCHSLIQLPLTGPNQCRVVTVRIRITGGAEWRDPLRIHDSIEFKTLEVNLTSEVSYQMILNFNCEKLLFKRLHVLSDQYILRVVRFFSY